MKMPTTVSAEPISSQRTSAGSPRAANACDAPWMATALDIVSATPALQYVDDRQHAKGHRQQDQGDGRGFGVGVFLELGGDQHGGDFTFTLNIAGNKHDAAVFADSASK